MIEQDISRTLSALGHTEAPTNLERRILLALNQRAFAQAERRYFAAAWVAAPAMIVFAALLVATHTNPSRPTQQAGASSSTIPLVVIPKGSTAAFEQIRQRSTTVARPLSSLLSFRSAAEESAVASNLAPTAEPEPGYPAPEAPLTDQEKLLLRLAHRPNQGLVAMFDPTIREERAAAEKAEFDFFNPPRPFQSAEEITNQLQEPHDEVSPGKQ